MQVKYLVQGPHMTPTGVRTEINGVPMAASVEAFEVSLRALDGMNGGTTLRFVGGDVEAAKSLFVNDAIVTAKFEKTDEKYEVK